MTIDTATAKATAWQQGWQDYLAGVHANPFDPPPTNTPNGPAATATQSRPLPRPSTWSRAMHNFKAGDLAVVVGCRIDPSSIGHVVELVERTLPGEFFSSPCGEIFHSEADEPGWVVLSDVDLDGWAHIAERHLMPLRGDFAPERQKSQEVPA